MTIKANQLKNPPEEVDLFFLLYVEVDVVVFLLITLAFLLGLLVIVADCMIPESIVCLN